MYKQLAVYYDEIYSFKNYQKEAEKLHSLIQQYKKSDGNTLLDVACGTGSHISHLKQYYAAEGLDDSPQMLGIARKKHPDILFHRGDMTSFKLQQRFDIITCLFSAIGHVKTKTRMRQAIRNMASHTKAGGIVLVEPWITPENFQKGIVGANYVDKSKLKIARINISRVRGSVSSFEYHYLIGTPRRIVHIIEKGRMGLWTHEEYQNAFRDAGLQLTYDTDGLMGRGLYLGLKPLG